MSGSDLYCASDALSTTAGICNLDFCIADYNGSCESYYVVNGQRISCSDCAADSDCVTRAANACSQSGIPSGGSTSPSTSSGCCNSSNSCSWEEDGACDCDGTFAWDYADCSAEDESGGCSVSLGKRAGGTGAALALALLGIGLLQRRRVKA